VAEPQTGIEIGPPGLLLSACPDAALLSGAEPAPQGAKGPGGRAAGLVNNSLCYG